MLPEKTNILIIGASISGLASAVALRKQGISFVIVEKEKQVATPWRNHYERLHLHTNKRISSLPFLKFEKKIPRYPSRMEVVQYLNNYKSSFNIEPIFNCEAISVQKNGDVWI